MEYFPDGHHVWLRSCGRGGMYLHADEEGDGMYLSPLRVSLHAAWQVHHVQHKGDIYLLLHSAAYRSYLATTLNPAPRGHIGHRVIQGVYDDPDQNSVFWNPIKVASKDDEVLLQNVSHGLLFRANGRYCKWRTGVSADDYFNRSVMMNWVVEAMPPRPFAPELPPPSPAAPPGGFWDKFFVRTRPVMEQRMIRFVRAAHDGSFDPGAWRWMVFHGRSVSNLRSALAEFLNEREATCIILCVRPGILGRLTPLVIDLPRNEQPIDFVVLSTLTPFAAELWFPDVDM